MEKFIKFCKRDYLLDNIIKFVFFHQYCTIVSFCLSFGFLTTYSISLLSPAPNVGIFIACVLTLSVVCFLILLLISLSNIFDNWIDGHYEKLYKQIK